MLSKSINANDINFGGMLVISNDTDPLCVFSRNWQWIDGVDYAGL